MHEKKHPAAQNLEADLCSLQFNFNNSHIYFHLAPKGLCLKLNYWDQTKKTCFVCLDLEKDSLTGWEDCRRSCELQTGYFPVYVYSGKACVRSQLEDAFFLTVSCLREENLKTYCLQMCLWILNSVCFFKRLSKLSRSYFCSKDTDRTIVLSKSA